MPEGYILVEVPAFHAKNCGCMQAAARSISNTSIGTG
jgi:hypothetical protein